jgi:hypothetical protein
MPKNSIINPWKQKDMDLDFMIVKPFKPVISASRPSNNPPKD